MWQVRVVILDSIGYIELQAEGWEPFAMTLVPLPPADGPTLGIVGLGPRAPRGIPDFCYLVSLRLFDAPSDPL